MSPTVFESIKQIGIEAGEPDLAERVKTMLNLNFAHLFSFSGGFFILRAQLGPPVSVWVWVAYSEKAGALGHWLPVVAKLAKAMTKDRATVMYATASRPAMGRLLVMRGWRLNAAGVYEYDLIGAEHE